MPRLGKFTRVWVGGYALTSYLTNAAMTKPHTEQECSAYEQDHVYLAGQADGSLVVDGWFAATAHTALATIATGTEKICTVAYGNNVAPVLGDPAVSIAAQELTYTPSPPLGGVIALNATFKPGAVTAKGCELGKLLADASFTGDTRTAYINNGAQSTAGGAAYLHILGLSPSDTVAVTIEDSATGSGAGTTIGTFTLDGSAIGAQRIAIAGTIRQYVCAYIDVTGTDVSFPVVINFVRY